MIKAFLQLLMWFRQINLSHAEIAGITVNVECDSYSTSQRLYRALLDLVGRPDEPSGTVNSGTVARIAGINFKITSRTCG